MNAGCPAPVATLPIRSRRGLSWWGLQWLGLGTFIAVSLGSIPGWRTKIPQCWKKKKKKFKEKGSAGGSRGAMGILDSHPPLLGYEDAPT